MGEGVVASRAEFALEAHAELGVLEGWEEGEGEVVACGPSGRERFAEPKCVDGERRRGAAGRSGGGDVELPAFEEVGVVGDGFADGVGCAAFGAFLCGAGEW